MINPIKKIGRYEFSVAGIMATEDIGDGTWAVYLSGGLKLTLTAAEKAELDEARGLHEKTMQVLGIVSTMQNANRPH